MLCKNVALTFLTSNEQMLLEVLKTFSSAYGNEFLREKLIKIYEPVFHQMKQILDENSETVLEKLKEDPLLNVFVLKPLEKICESAGQRDFGTRENNHIRRGRELERPERPCDGWRGSKSERPERRCNCWRGSRDESACQHCGSWRRDTTNSESAAN